MRERWRTVPGSPGYQVSARGRVRNATTGHVLVLLVHSSGYLKAKLGRSRYEYVHRLVCEAFHGPPPADQRYHADHINHDRADNRPENVRWLPAHLNEWRWKAAEDDIAPPDGWEPMSAAEAAEIDAQLAETAGW